MHMGVMSFTVREFLKRVPKDKLRPGDVWFLNLPHVGGNHLPDVKAIRPVFVGGEILAFAVSLAHWADVGGAVPGSYVPFARDAWQEGLRISPLRVFTADGVDREKLDIILVVEPDDQETRNAIAQWGPGPPVEVLTAPATQPRTKPKALNWALPFARGSFVTIFLCLVDTCFTSAGTIEYLSVFTFIQASFPHQLFGGLAVKPVIEFWMRFSAPFDETAPVSERAYNA